MNTLEVHRGTLRRREPQIECNQQKKAGACYVRQECGNNYEKFFKASVMTFFFGNVPISEDFWGLRIKCCNKNTFGSVLLNVDFRGL